VTSAAAIAAAASAGTAAATARTVTRRHPGGRRRWLRSNYRERTVDLAGGPAAAAGVLTAAVPLALAGSPGGVTAVAAAAGLGLYDDLAGGTHARGLRGHLRALARGEVTSGLVKMVGLAGAGLLAAGADRRGSSGSGPAMVVVDGALVAGAANLLNLLDLRPGRALKVATAAAVPLAAGRGPAAPLGGAVLGTAAALLPADLGERRMLGDCGANALGAALGWAATRAVPPAGRVAVLTAVVALTLASERVSFSQVIADVPVLDALDRVGRRPG
jgi:hypothetical protein